MRLFGAKVAALRQQHGLSQADVAAHLGCSRGYINNLEAGRKYPSLAMVLRFAQMFDVQVDALLRDSTPVDQLLSHHNADSKPTLDAFGPNLYQLRTAAGFTQADLADHLAIQTQAYISLLEHRKKYPSPTLLLHIADMFGITVDMLLHE